MSAVTKLIHKRIGRVFTVSLDDQSWEKGKRTSSSFLFPFFGNYRNLKRIVWQSTEQNNLNAIVAIPKLIKNFISINLTWSKLVLSNSASQENKNIKDAENGQIC